MQQIFDKQTWTEKIRKALRRYQKMGWPVIPCDGKKPLLPDWPKRTAPPTDAEIKEWPEKWPDMNIGLVLGPASRIVGIDVDGSLGLERLLDICGGESPETYMYKTGSEGGLRLLFRLPEGTQKAVKYVEKLAGDHSELAFMGEGQQTILPPSSHSSGKLYT